MIAQSAHAKYFPEFVVLTVYIYRILKQTETKCQLLTTTAVT